VSSISKDLNKAKTVELSVASRNLRSRNSFTGPGLAGNEMNAQKIAQNGLNLNYQCVPYHRTNICSAKRRDKDSIDSPKLAAVFPSQYSIYV
jgi:hypothetical protein